MTEPARSRCQACGVPNAIHARFCRGCGTELPRPELPQAGPQETDAPPAVPAVAEASLTATDFVRAGDRAWGEVRGVAALFVAMLVIDVAGFVAHKAGASDAKTDVALTIALAGVVAILVATSRQQLAPLLRTVAGWKGLLGAGVAMAIIVLFGAVYFPAVEALGFPVVRMSDPHLEAGWPRWTIYVLIAVAPAITEELAFRGYVMARLSTVLTAWEVLLVQAALFSVLHLGVVIFPSHFFIGLVLGLLRRKTASLYPGMAVHAAWNARVLWSELM